MEKEKAMKDMSKESMDQVIEETQADNAATEVTDDMGEAEATVAEDAMAEAGPVAEEAAVEEEAAPGSAGEKQEKAVKSLFKNSKSKEIAAKDQKIEELTDRLMRTMAEFENYRKRTEKEKATMYDMGIKSMIEKLLPIIDNFERGLGTVTDKEKESGFAQGIEMIYRQLMTALDEIGLKPIDAVGKEFDPNLHNAVMHGEDENLGENIVSDEFQKGYMYRDMVVRHSMVKVVN
ncbi:MAG TPA: nucleotide exchange factor GrpE [Clostridiales bacterium]|nr:nucleotide exchange factor GrpE [Clostridiales bacterium]